MVFCVVSFFWIFHSRSPRAIERGYLVDFIIANFSLPKEIACTCLTVFEPGEMESTILVRTFPYAENRTLAVMAYLKPTIWASVIRGGKGMEPLVGHSVSWFSTPAGSVMVVWQDERPDNERVYQSLMDRIGAVMKGLYLIATA